MLRPFFLGAISGAALTLLGVYFYPATPDSPQALAPQGRHLGVSMPALQPTSAAPQMVAPFERTPQMTAANSPAQLQPSPRPAPGLAPERAPAVISLSVPIALSAEHAKVLLPTGDVGRRLSLAELHMQLSSEIKDPSWAPEAEQAIRQALAAGNASGEFELMNVECRASLCEVLAFGNLPSSGKRWNQLWDEMAQEEWYQSFKGNSTTSSARNGRYTIVTILERPKR